MDELILLGNKYISSKRAAKLSGYTTDYIGQMCRGNTLECKRVGRGWYIKEQSLRGQKKSFQKAQKTAEYIKQVVNSNNIDPKKIEFEPLQYTNDDHSNNIEIDKNKHSVAYESSYKPVQLESGQVMKDTYVVKTTPITTIKEKERVLRKNNINQVKGQQRMMSKPAATPRKSNTVVTTTNIQNQQLRRSPMQRKDLPRMVVHTKKRTSILNMIAVLFLIGGFLFTLGTATMEQVVYYTTLGENTTTTDLRLIKNTASITKSISFKQDTQYIKALIDFII